MMSDETEKKKPVYMEDSKVDLENCSLKETKGMF